MTQLFPLNIDLNVKMIERNSEACDVDVVMTAFCFVSVMYVSLCLRVRPCVLCECLHSIIIYVTMRI